MEPSNRMKYFVFLLGASTLTFAIRVPSSWQPDENNGRSRYRDIRPSRHENQLHRKMFNENDENTSRPYFRPQLSLSEPYNSPVTRNNWTPLARVPNSANKRLVKHKLVNYGKPFIGPKLKEPTSRKLFRPSSPESGHLEFYMTPKTVLHKPFSKPQLSRSQASSHINKPQNIFSTPQPRIYFDPFATTQPESSDKQILNPNEFASSTNVDIDQVFNNFDNSKVQTDQPHQQIGSFSSFTTAVPTVQNFDQFFEIPPNYRSVEFIQNQKPVGHIHNTNHIANFNNPPGYNLDSSRSDDLQTNNLHSSTSSWNVNGNVNHVKNHKMAEPFQNREFENHLHKNYRDDKTHEPINFDPFLDTEQIPEVERDESEKSPISSHEHPAEVPTKPIYPGPGRWAKPGIKHRPFISKQKYDKLEESEVTPDGYDTFVKEEQVFNKLSGKFGKDLNDFPKKHKLGQFLKKDILNSKTDESENVEDPSKEDENGHEKEEGEEEEIFVPTRLYAQVRQSEDVEHLPADQADEPRLRESIKESKIQTVYTEEGYEDSAYDHAGHEKEAENEERFAEIDRTKETIKVKKVPAHKYNLHLKPKYESTEYGDVNDLPTDEEIEQYKREELGLEDSDPAGSQYGVSSNSIAADEKSRTGSEVPEKRTMKRNNNFISTKEMKTITTMENAEGDTETEITSRVKMIIQPNNQSKTHEYIKIYPKIHSGTIGRNDDKSRGDEETIAKVEELAFEPKQNLSNGIYIEEIITTPNDIPITTVPTSEFTEIFTEEIPITTLATTAIPSASETTSKTEAPETLESIEKAFWGIRSKSRKKRFINDFPKIEVDTDFISDINHDLEKPKEDNLDSKYPYYVKSGNDGINENSPLRYSENLGNIPLKKEGNMAFYEQAERMIVCPEIETIVEPIPERVKNADRLGDESKGNHDEDEGKETAETDGNVADNSEISPKQPKSPRLRGLDDKINCLKAKYFGKNPLDSPFFAEETVGTIKPIFEVFQNQKKNINELKKENNNYTNKDGNAENEAVSASDYEHEDNQTVLKSKNITTTTTDIPTTINFDKLSLEVLNDVTNNMNEMVQPGDRERPAVQTTPTISLLTTPQYTIDLKPKHIYDQIQLLNHLPAKQNSNGNRTGKNAIQIKTENGENSNEIHQAGTTRQPKIVYREEEDDSSMASSSISENLTYDSSEDSSILPDAEALRRRRKFKTRRNRLPYHIHGIKRTTPTTSQPIFGNHITASTVLPKYKVLSEVFYKDEIKPNEQLNVFTDILNNIRNSSQEASMQYPPESVTATLGSKNRIGQSKLAEKYDSYLKAYSDQEVDNSYYDSTVSSTTTTTVEPNVHRGTTGSVRNGQENTRYIQDRESLDKYKLYIALLDAKNKKDSGSTMTTNPPLHPSEYDDFDSEAKTSKVMGLMPPGKHRYKTIHHPKRDNQNDVTNPGYIEKKIINNFFVMGMKPPPKQRVYLYYEFGNKNYDRIRRVPLRRGKRSTNRSSYAQLARNREQEDDVEKTMTDDDDDDYVPHRPKNFYYDEKTGKIVYNNIKKPEEDSEEDVEYVEIVEEPAKTTPKSKSGQNPIFATATPPPEGQSYIDFVKKLKSAVDYTLIPDPTTTERGAEVSTEKVVITTMKSEPTEPPEFLSILGKVRENSGYKFIEDKKDKAKVTVTTTEAPEEIAEEEEDEDEETIPTKNSPGKVQHDLPHGLEIFDISDYIPNLRNYLPKTSIDTSKYKTIRRPTVASVSETESDSEEEGSETADTPISKIPDSKDTENSQTSTNNRPVFIDTTKMNDGIVTEIREESTSSPLTTITTTTPKQLSPSIQTRRRRPTTMRSVVNMRRQLSSTTTPQPQTEHHPTSKRNYRRRPTRIRVPMVKKSPADDDVEDTTRMLRRRSNLYEHKANRTVKSPATAESSMNRPRIEPKKYIEGLKKYNQNKRHGGDSHKNLGHETSYQSSTESATGTSRKSKDVEVISEYNEDEKHGGNYKKDVIEEEKSEESDESKEKALIINLLPEYRREDRTESSDNTQVETSTATLYTPKTDIPTNKPKRIIIKEKKRYKEVNKPVQRLTDVVTKPESFYNDPSLPRSINMLMGVETLSSEEIGNIAEAETSDEDIRSDIEISPDEINKQVNSSTLKKPGYIEDPSERLYYYAPI